MKNLEQQNFKKGERKMKQQTTTYEELNKFFNTMHQKMQKNNWVPKPSTIEQEVEYELYHLQKYFDCTEQQACTLRKYYYEQFKKLPNYDEDGLRVPRTCLKIVRPLKDNKEDDLLQMQKKFYNQKTMANLVNNWYHNQKMVLNNLLFHSKNDKPYQWVMTYVYINKINESVLRKNLPESCLNFRHNGWTLKELLIELKEQDLSQEQQYKRNGFIYELLRHYNNSIIKGIEAHKNNLTRRFYELMGRNTNCFIPDKLVYANTVAFKSFKKQMEYHNDVPLLTEEQITDLKENGKYYGVYVQKLYRNFRSRKIGNEYTEEANIEIKPYYSIHKDNSLGYIEQTETEKARIKEPATKTEIANAARAEDPIETYELMDEFHVEQPAQEIYKEIAYEYMQEAKKLQKYYKSRNIEEAYRYTPGQELETPRKIYEAYTSYKWIKENLGDEGLLEVYNRCPVCGSIYHESKGCYENEECHVPEKEFLAADNILYSDSKSYEDLSVSDKSEEITLPKENLQEPRISEKMERKLHKLFEEADIGLVEQHHEIDCNEQEYEENIEKYYISFLQEELSISEKVAEKVLEIYQNLL